VEDYINQLKIKLTNNSTKVGYVTILQARGPIFKEVSVTGHTEDVDSGTKYGKRTWPSRPPFIYIERMRHLIDQDRTYTVPTICRRQSSSQTGGYYTKSRR
jgi:hypothetical protein